MGEMRDAAADHGLRVGYIGLGDMGAAMALNLIDRGWPLALYARRAASLEPFRALPAAIKASPREVGAACDALCLCVVDESQIEEVLFGPLGAVEGLAPGSVVIVHSTIAPEACRGFAARLAASGLHFLDAPVTGAAARGRAGELTVLVGGDAEVAARCRPLFEAEGSLVAHLGDVGAGQLVKLLNNGLFVVQVSLVDEMLKLGAAMGLDTATLLKVLDSGTAASWASGYCARVADKGAEIFNDYPTSYPGGVIEIVRKDIRLFTAQLRERGLGAARMVGLASGAVDSITHPLAQQPPPG